MVCGNAPFQAVEPLVEAQSGEVLVRQAHGGGQGEGADLPALVLIRQSQSGVQALSDCLITPCPTEQEVDRWKQAVVAQPLDHLAAPRGLRAAEAPLSRARTGPPLGDMTRLVTGQPDEIRVDDLLVVVDEQVVHARTGHHVLPERDRAVLLDDDLGRTPHRGEPCAELLGVADCCRQCHDGGGLREVDHHLLPHRTSKAVGEIVHLIHHDVAEVGEGRGVRVEHVPEDFSGHDDHGGLTVDGVVSREQPDVLGSMPVDEVVVLLIGEGLDGSRVEALASLTQCQVDRELPHDRLARSCGGCHEDTRTGLQGLAGPDLERIQFESVLAREGSELGTLPTGSLTRSGVALSRARLLSGHEPSSRGDISSSSYSA